ncbi:MAG: hypothetical protein LUD29_00480 [Clostridia bacterium]|nr:hypothetical protein [Clostridia bacterium]
MVSALLNPGPVRDCVGFTAREVEDLAKKYGMSYDDFKYWYDGYNLDGIEIYNSNSVYRALTENDLQCYWEKTESFEELFGYIKENRFGIHRVILDLLSDIKRTVNFSGYMNDLVTINNLDDILAILVHLGYLAFDKKTSKKEDAEKKAYPGETLSDDDVLRLMVKSDGTVRIPNHEIREEFLTVLENLGSFESNEFELLSAKIVSLTFNGSSDEDMEALAERIERVHDEYVSDYHNYDTEDSLSNTVRLAYFNLINDYYSRTEASLSRGRTDVIFTSRKGKNFTSHGHGVQGGRHRRKRPCPDQGQKISQGFSRIQRGCFASRHRVRFKD